jgi:hypothetical protein
MIEEEEKELNTPSNNSIDMNDIKTGRETITNLP